ncbi:MAG: hypothetical protein OXQ30_14480, partial [Boseongicola sp.]|nr:hypothetical protein [Boseongicola sp.]
ARIADRSAADSGAAMVEATLIVMMIAPAFMGWVSEYYGLRAAFATALPSFILTLMLVRRALGPR